MKEILAGSFLLYGDNFIEAYDVHEHIGEIQYGLFYMLIF